MGVRSALCFNGTENIICRTSKVLCPPARWIVSLRHRAVAVSLGVISFAQLGASPTMCPFNARRPMYQAPRFGWALCSDGVMVSPDATKYAGCRLGSGDRVEVILERHT